MQEEVGNRAKIGSPTARGSFTWHAHNSRLAILCPLSRRRLARSSWHVSDKVTEKERTRDSRVISFYYAGIIWFADFAHGRVKSHTSLTRTDVGLRISFENYSQVAIRKVAAVARWLHSSIDCNQFSMSSSLSDRIMVASDLLVSCVNMLHPIWSPNESASMLAEK